MRRLAIPALLLALLPLCADAQRTRAADTAPHVSPAFGLHYGSALRLSAALGFIVDRSRTTDDGLIVLLEPGQGGTEVAAGYYKSLGRFGSAYSLRAAVIRTREEPWNATPRSTYVGAEGQFLFVLGVGVRAGVFRRASRSVGDQHDNLATLSLTLGA
jgi:hypothetical protein